LPPFFNNFFLKKKRATNPPPKTNKCGDEIVHNVHLGKRPSQKPKKEIDIYPNLHAVQTPLHLPSYYNQKKKQTLGSVGNPLPTPPQG
jgi:hypothetical protein